MSVPTMFSVRVRSPNTFGPGPGVVRRPLEHRFDPVAECLAVNNPVVEVVLDDAEPNGPPRSSMREKSKLNSSLSPICVEPTASAIAVIAPADVPPRLCQSL